MDILDRAGQGAKMNSHTSRISGIQALARPTCSLIFDIGLAFIVPVSYILAVQPHSFETNHVFTRLYDAPDLGLIFFLPMALLLGARILFRITKGIRLAPRWGAMLCIVALPDMWSGEGLRPVSP